MGRRHSGQRRISSPSESFAVFLFWHLEGITKFLLMDSFPVLDPKFTFMAYKFFGGQAPRAIATSTGRIGAICEGSAGVTRDQHNDFAEPARS
mmetsp:Transcript_151806/g.368703  ORF Transcript_151806/g.368703 Transcript_151806/m.368703 type:complete len:93 (+) Transcript_151806:2351-2629(+)